MMWILLLSLLAVSSALVCPDGEICQSRNTCCKNPEGQYACCPLPYASCCSDHLHCCYEKTVCDLVHNRCVNKTVSLPLMRRVAAEPAPLVPQLEERVEAVVCPDQESECPDDTTCCQLVDGSWGCCQFAKAVCCVDKRHCCPEGTICDLEHLKCVSSSLESFRMLEKLPSRRRGNTSISVAPPGGSVSCPGGKSSCPDSYTCCLLSSGDYGCCPSSQAMCCSDHLHCCPSNTICDLEHGVCKSGETSATPLKKIAAAAPKDVECPDQSECPDQTTCCKMTDDTYGCCPMPNAICCSDRIHCCPEGTDCDVAHGACVSARGEIAMTMPATVTPLLEVQSKGGVVPCNDSVACADGNTCCKLPNEGWACCTLPKAVCCEDHLHCCPHGTVCNLEASTCDDAAGISVTPWHAKEPAFPLPTANTKCDKTTSCPVKSTCCRTQSGGWACCPLPQAVCCDDLLHCCPHATVCNMEAQTCDDPAGFLPPVRWVEKVSALTSGVEKVWALTSGVEKVSALTSGVEKVSALTSGVEKVWALTSGVEKVSALTSGVEKVKCDEQTMCRRGTTCCKNNSGQWACCPLPQAVCCNDGEHCCPEGHTCNMAAKTCDKPGALDLPWLQKTRALQREPSRARNMCDAQTSCPRDTTCCFMHQAHRWGCCPLPQAVCCEDGDHCCPSGHTCEPHRSACSKGARVVGPWFSKRSARSEPRAVTDVKCDDKSSCASGTTCCRLQTGEWGCCPLVKAVCCADQEHCCPQGYTCNMQTGTCEKTSHDALPLPQLKVVRSEPGDTEVVPCDLAGEFHCSGRDTCCKVSASEWACCPSARAVCCPDSRHCCPAGHSCDLQGGGCSPDAQLTWDALIGDRRKDFVPRGL